MPRVAFITAAKWRDLYFDDRLAADELTRRGVEVTPIVWDETQPATLVRFDAVVMRSPWDWYRRTTEFRAWLDALEGVRARIFNPPPVLSRFAAKTYFKALEAQGLPVVPTTWLTAAQLDSLPALLERAGLDEAVVKPAFSANAFRTSRVRAANAEAVASSLRELPPETELMLQPYFPEIEAGESSLVFFGGQFSHAVRKRPKPGDFRVQVEHGGSAEPVVASASLVEQARAVLHAAAPDTLYARVDGVVRGGRLNVMELELVEPELFFRFEPGAPARFAAALEARLARPAPS